MKKQNSIPFPFLGAGFGHYFETCEIHILFQAQPDDEQKKLILASIPPPIQPHDHHCFEGKYFLTCSDELVNAVIESTYGQPKKKGRRLRNDAYFVSEQAAQKFEQEIERWLIEVNGVCPIEIVYRPEDDEAGGTELSKWHKDSVLPSIQLLDKWHTTFSSRQFNAEHYSIFASAILDYAKKKIDDAKAMEYGKLFLPDLWVEKMLHDMRYDVLEDELSHTQPATSFIDAVCKGLHEFFNQQRHQPSPEKLPHHLLRKVFDMQPTRQAEKDKAFWSTAFTSFLVSGDQERLAQLEHRMVNTSIVYYQSFFYQAYSFVYTLHEKQQQLLPAATGYLSLIRINLFRNFQSTDLSFYCNAIVCLESTLRLRLLTPVDIGEDYLHKTSEHCESFARANPLISFNAGWLYIEMKAFEQAYRSFRTYFRSSSDKIEIHLNKLLKYLHEDRKYQEFKDSSYYQKLVEEFVH